MRIAALFTSLLLTACANAPALPPADTAETIQLSPGVAWVVAAEGWATEAEEVYADAASYVQDLASSRPAKSWAVVLDIDETVLNNVEYQVSRERIAAGFSAESWHAWTQEARATLVPGAAGFIEAVNAAGGHVALVTNRSDTEQLATEINLASVGLLRGEDFRVLLTRAYPTAPGEKDGRFDLVPAMLAAQGFADVEVVAFVGDNVGDKPKAEGDWKFFCIDQGAMYGAPCAAVPGPGK
ncbi:MAG: hypothetical protein IPK75_13320 [Acidobacteria bacterium]|nr:hypothetical protein [Acidobacteriota bacterium]